MTSPVTALKVNSGGVKVSAGARGILRSSSVGPGHSNLSLQQVIHKIVGGRQSAMPVRFSESSSASTRNTRSRSLSMSDVVDKPKQNEYTKTSNAMSLTAATGKNVDFLIPSFPVLPDVKPKVKREGTPDSDA